MTLYAKWVENPSYQEKKYNLEDEDGNQISFPEDEGHLYRFHLVDYLAFTSDEIETLGVSLEEYNAVLGRIEDATKDFGKLLSFYEIEVLNEEGDLIHEGPLQIHIKMTDEMKQYNTFKIVYIDALDTLSLEEPISLASDGEYLSGTLNHLSTYALVGSNEPVSNRLDPTGNPHTNDPIYVWFGLLMISFVGLSLGLFVFRRRLVQ